MLLHQWWLCVWTTCPVHKMNQSWAQHQPRDTLKFSRYTIKISLLTHCISCITKMSDVTTMCTVCGWSHGDSYEKVEFHESKVVQTVTLPYKTIRDWKTFNIMMTWHNYFVYHTFIKKRKRLQLLQFDYCTWPYCKSLEIPFGKTVPEHLLKNQQKMYGKYYL